MEIVSNNQINKISPCENPNSWWTGTVFRFDILWVTENMLCETQNMLYANTYHISKNDLTFHEWNLHFRTSRNLTFHEWNLHFGTSRNLTFHEWNLHFGTSWNLTFHEWNLDFGTSRILTFHEWNLHFGTSRNLTFHEWNLDFGTSRNLTFHEWNSEPNVSWMEPSLRNLSEPSVSWMEPSLRNRFHSFGTSRNLVQGFGRLPQTTPKLYWKNPKPFRLLGKKLILFATASSPAGRSPYKLQATVAPWHEWLSKPLWL